MKCAIELATTCFSDIATHTDCYGQNMLDVHFSKYLYLLGKDVNLPFCQPSEVVKRETMGLSQTIQMLALKEHDFAENSLIFTFWVTGHIVRRVETFWG